MIKVELASVLDKRGGKSQAKYNAIIAWSHKYKGMTHHKVVPSRDYVLFYDDESFDMFKETYNETWRRIY